MSSSIYVASLSDYNAGRLVGFWLSLDECGNDPDTVGETIAEFLASLGTDEVGSVREEYAIHDYDGPIGSLANTLGEYPSLSTVCVIAEAIDSGADSAAVLAYIEHVGASDIEWDRFAEVFEDSYKGEWSSLADYAYDLEESCGSLVSVPEHLEAFIDWDRYARDLELAGDYWTAPADMGNVFVFWSHGGR